MTVADLIAELQKYEPSLRVVSFHEDTSAHQVMKQLQFVRSSMRHNTGGMNWVILQSSPMNREDAK